MNWPWRRRTRDEELDEEIRAHIEMSARVRVERGATENEARAAARREFGNVGLVRETTRDVWGFGWIEPIAQDVRYGARALIKAPGFAAIAVLTLALGIGATTAIFTVAYATLLAPLPYPNSERLVMVWSEIQSRRAQVSPADFADWKKENTTFDSLNAWETDDFNIATQDAPEPEMVDGVRVTPGYFSMLGRPLFLGRDFLSDEAEAGRNHVVILAYRLWQRLGANPRIIGQTMLINGETCTVVGVLPPASVFEPGSVEGWDEDIVVPFVFEPARFNRAFRFLLIAGRLKPGVTAKQAQDDIDSVATQEARNYPETNRGRAALVEPYQNDFLPSERQFTLRLLVGAVGFLLLLACLNVANLLLAKGITRQREVAVRGALGAQRATIFAQFLTESLVLAVLGGILGVATGYVMLRVMTVVMPPTTLPVEAVVRLNFPVLLFALAVTTLSGVLFGCAPAWYASRLDPAEFLKEGGRSGVGAGRHRVRRLLVIAEFALALPLLAAAGLMIRSFRNLTRTDLGVRADHVLGFYVESMPTLKDPTLITPYYRRFVDGIAAVPGVSDVCAMTYLPFENLHWGSAFAIVGGPVYSDPSQRPSADVQMVTPDYFKTFGIQIVKGRSFTDADNASSPRVVMVNEAFVKAFLGGVDPLNQRVAMEQVIFDLPKTGPVVDWQIVGVFHTVKTRGLREDHPEIDASFWQMGAPLSAIGVRTTQDPATMMKSIAAAVNAVDPGAALYKPRTVEQMHDDVLANDRFPVILITSFAVVALLLATVGIHGVTSFSVAQRTHEIGVRMALGATRNRVVALVVGEGVALASAGLGLGLIGAYFLGRAMQSVLFGVGAIDFSALSAVGLLLAFAALLACYLPARRATRVDPVVALRYE